MSKSVAVILAGGVGMRVGLDLPKQLIKIAGRTILEHTIASLHDHPLVDELIIMMTPGHLDAVRGILQSGLYPKVTHLLEGADTRNGTTERALAVIEGDDTKVLFHDAVRPLVSARIVTDCLEALENYDAVDVAIPSADTIIQVSSENVIVDVPDRSMMRRGQTPQAFRNSTIKRAYAGARRDPNFVATDDCTVVLRYLPDVPIWVVAGDERNMKVTEPIDVFVVEKLFQLSSTSAIPLRQDDEYRRELQDKVVVIFGASYGIGADLAALARGYGARVAAFSRSGTGTHVERRSDVNAAARDVMKKYGRVDYVVNTAGVLPRGLLAETSEETVYSATDVNYLAAIWIAQEFHDALVSTGGGLLLFTSSSYTRGRGGYSLYSSAKAAIVNLTQALADEWASSGVRINCVNPERTATPMRSKAFGVENSETLLLSEEVAKVSLDALLSRGTGHVIDVRRVDPLTS